MKLLIVSHPCVTASNQQFFADIEHETGWELILVAPERWNDEYGNSLELTAWPSFNGRVIGLPVGGCGKIILHRYSSGLYDLLESESPDAIYVHHEPYAVATAQVYIANAAGSGAPIGFYSAQNLQKRYPAPFRFAESLIYRSSSFAFPVSVDVETVLRSKGYRGPSHVLPLGIDPAVHFPRVDSGMLRSRLCRSPQEILVGYIGRIVEEKGLLTLLRALKEIEDLPWRLVVVGAGPFEAEFDSFATRLEISQRVTRVGYIPHTEAPSYLSAVDVAVVPSESRAHWKEQFGRVVVEAMACGTPVIGSDSGEIPHIIRSSRGGLIFAEGDSHDLARQLGLMISDTSLREQYSNRGRDSVISQYSNRVLAARFAEAVSRSAKMRTLHYGHSRSHRDGRRKYEVIHSGEDLR